jgi:hypothetical protein
MFDDVFPPPLRVVVPGGLGEHAERVDTQRVSAPVPVPLPGRRVVPVLSAFGFGVFGGLRLVLLPLRSFAVHSAEGQ